MAMPSVVAVGTVASGTGNITPGLPAGWTDDDILILAVETENQVASPPAGWASVNGGTVIVATGVVTRLTVLWRRAVAGDAAPTVTDPGDHAIGRIIAVRGCVAIGNPWTVTASATELVADTSVSIPGATTTVPDCLVLAMFSTGTDVTSTAHVTGWANADLATVTEWMDDWTSSGLGGGLGMCSGEKAVAGVYGATTATVGTGNFKALMSIALASVGPDLPTINGVSPPAPAQ